MYQLPLKPKLDASKLKSMANLLEQREKLALSAREHRRNKLKALIIPFLLTMVVGIGMLVLRHYLFGGTHGAPEAAPGAAPGATLPLGAGPVPGSGLALVSELMRDLGIAIIVAGFSVFGYELVGDLTKVEYQSETLQMAARTIEVATEELESMKTYASNNAISGILELKSKGVLAKPLTDLIDSALMVAGNTSAGPTAYSDFAQWYIEEIGKGLKQLATYRVEATFPNYQIGYQFSAPQPRHVISKILVAEISQLQGENDTYDSITNPLFYEHGLMLTFRKNIESAASRGVKTRRIFNLAGMLNALGEEKIYSAAQLIDEHLALARTNSSYEVRFITNSPWPHCIKALSSYFNTRDAENQHIANAEDAMFGIFSHGSESPAWATLVIGKDQRRLNQIELRRVPPNCPTAQLFNELWDNWAHDKNPFENYTFNPSCINGRRVVAQPSIQP